MADYICDGQLTFIVDDRFAVVILVTENDRCIVILTCTFKSGEI